MVYIVNVLCINLDAFESFRVLIRFPFKHKIAISVHFIKRNLKIFCAFVTNLALNRSSFANSNAMPVPTSYLIPVKFPVSQLATAYNRLILLLFQMCINTKNKQKIYDN